MKSLFAILFCFLAAGSNTFAQEEIIKSVEGVPADLNKSKVIFLRYDSVEVDATDKKANYYQGRHNKNTPSANAELEEAAKKYPFEYIIASRKDIDALKEKGYKYLLDCEAYKNMKDGFRQDTQSKSVIVSVRYALYLQDLETNKAYILTDNFNENQLYFPKFVMNKMVIPKVNKKFKK